MYTFRRWSLYIYQEYTQLVKSNLQSAVYTWTDGVNSEMKEYRLGRMGLSVNIHISTDTFWVDVHFTTCTFHCAMSMLPILL